MNIALITGISGQTGSYLAGILLKNGFKVYGTSRTQTSSSYSNLFRLGISKYDVDISALNLLNPNEIENAFHTINPTHVFHLAGLSSVALSFENPIEAHYSISTACINLLNYICLHNKDIRFFNSGSSECFGNVQIEANEDSPFRPLSPYASAKVNSIHNTSIMRMSKQLHASNGILSNHESPLRSRRFVTAKVIQGLLNIRNGSTQKVELGNLSTVRDWGWAADYADAMHKVITADNPSDYIIATGESHSLLEFIQYACSSLTLSFDDCITANPSIRRPLDISCSKLSPQKINSKLGWHAKTRFFQVIDNLLANKLY